MTIKEILENGTQEQIDKLRDCKTAEEVLALAKELGIVLDKAQNEELAALFQTSTGELSDDVLDKIAGGWCNYMNAKRFG
jgi:hypothetical protein